MKNTRVHVCDYCWREGKMTDALPECPVNGIDYCQEHFEIIEAAPTEALAQPPPVKNENPAVWDLVLADMQARDKTGLQRYGTRLQGHNGRDALRDAYEEALDLCVYLRQALFEKDGK